MMQLDEAIKHAEEVAEKNEKQASYFWNKDGNPNYEKCVECAEEHRQLAEWLKELKRVREQPWLKELKALREQKRPHGRWIIVDDCEHFIAKCSVCGRIEDSRLVQNYLFCHCGADMREEGDPDDRA